MRTNYPVLSDEFNDKFQDLYYKLTYLLGYDDESGNTTYEGLYDIITLRLNLIYKSILNLENKNNGTLVFYKDTPQEIPLYSEWGKSIMINTLRSM